MLHHFRTLRFRLTLLFVLVFGGIQLGLWIVVEVLLTRSLVQRFDASLRDRAQSIVEAIDSPGGVPTAADAYRAWVAPFEAPNVFIQLRRPDGRTLFTSRNLRGASFPMPDLSAEGGRVPQYQTLSRGFAGALPAEGTSLRLATLLIDTPPERPLVVQVASDLRPVRHAVGETHLLLAVFIFVSLVLAGMTAWHMTGRYLTPIGDIARRAREISASHLDERLPIPRTHGELTDMVHVINEMLERLETEFRDQQRFIADASHELKTPLAVLLGEAHALRLHAHLTPETEEFIGSVEEETRQLLRTVEGFLILSRALSGSYPKPRGDASVEDAVLRAIERCRRTADGRRVRVVPRFETGPNTIEPHVEGDEDLLCSMVENLIRNAIRYSPEGEDIDVRVVAAAEEVHIAVKDHGPGIPDEQIPRVFDMFYQAGPGGSAGIGLSIVRAVAEMHGGRVAVRNGTAGGSDFVVQLPLRADSSLHAADGIP